MKFTHALNVPFIGSSEEQDEENEYADDLPETAAEIGATSEIDDEEEIAQQTKTDDSSSSGGIMSKMPFVGGSDDEEQIEEEVQTIASGRIENIEDAPYTHDEVLTAGDEKLAEWKNDMDGDVIDPIGRLHRDFVAPSEVEFSSDMVELPTEWVQVMYINDWPETATPGFLEQLFSNSVYKTDVSIHLEPRDQRRAMSDLKDNIGALQAKLEEEMKGSSVSARDTQKDLQDAEQMYDLVSRSNMTMFDTSMYVTHRAYSPEGIIDNMSDVRGMLEKPPASTDPRVARRRQDKGMVSASPIGLDEMNKKTPMMGGAIGAMMPFSSSTLIEEGGVDFGVQPYNGSPVIVDRFGRDMGYNMLTIGNIGSGKSFSTKLNLVRTMMRQEDVDIIMLDPLQGFIGITEALSGNRIVVGGDVGLNPLEIQETPERILEQSDGDLDPYTGKLKDVMSFFETFFQMRNMELGDDRGILEKAIQASYEDKGITRDPETHGNDSPTMADVLENLRKMAEEGADYAFSSADFEEERIKDGASRMLVSLQPFRKGGEFENLSRQTDINISESRVTYLDLQQQEGRGGTGLMMQLLFNAVYERAKNTQNKVIFAIDEARYIMKDAANLDFLEQAVRHSRHYDLSIQFITQTADEFFAHEQSEAIASNCSIKQFNRVEELDRGIALDKLGMNEAQLEYVKNAQAGSDDVDYSSALLFVQEYGWLPIHIKASQQEAAVVDFDPDDETKEEALPGYQTNNEDASTARITQALKASSSDTQNVEHVGGESTMQEKLDSVGEVPEEATHQQTPPAQNRDELEDLEKEDLIELIQSGDYADVVGKEPSDKLEEKAEDHESDDSGVDDDSSHDTETIEKETESIESDTENVSQTQSKNTKNKLYHIRTIAEQSTEHDSMPVLDALEDAFTVVGTEPSKDAIRAGSFGIGFDAIIATTITDEEIKSALETVERVKAITVKQISDDIDLNNEAGQITGGNVNIDTLLAEVDANISEATKTFEELKQETEYTDNYDEIENEMREIGFSEIGNDEIEFDELVDDDDFEFDGDKDE